jgi:3-dehydroquinate dehydratase-2
MKEKDKKIRKVIIINGPNLNLLGNREEKIYGVKSFDDVFCELGKIAENSGIKLLYFQSNKEGEIIDKIHECIKNVGFIIINPGALTHYSYSIHDAILASKIPTVEVHISNIFKREEWRRKSVISPSVSGVISGFGTYGYNLALMYAINYLNI